MVYYYLFWGQFDASFVCNTFDMSSKGVRVVQLSNLLSLPLYMMILAAISVSLVMVIRVNCIWISLMAQSIF